MGGWPAGRRAAAPGHGEVRRVHGRAGTAAADAGGRARERAEGPAARSDGPRSRALVDKHHGLATVRNHTIFQMITDGARQDAPFDVAALAHEIVGRVAMADALDVLVDDRPLVEIGGDVVRGGADQLDAAVMGLVVGPRALE